MGLDNSDDRWGWPVKLLHWTMAVLIIGMVVGGVLMANFTGWIYDDMLDATTLRVDLTQLHKSFGFVVFVLACIRIAWRWFASRTPQLPYGTPGWQKVAVGLTHYGMYVLMFVMPLSGWLMSSASPLNDVGAYPAQIKNMVFGLFEMPDPFTTGDRDLSDIFRLVHEYAGYALALLILLHVAGVLFHHFILRDSVLKRMLPSVGSRSNR